MVACESSKCKEAPCEARSRASVICGKLFGLVVGGDGVEVKSGMLCWAGVEEK